MNTTSNRPPVLITMGDPAGIGPEIVVKALNARPSLGPCVVVGDGATMQRAQAAVARANPDAARWQWAVVESMAAAAQLPSDRVALVQACAPVNVAWGRVQAAAGQAAADCIRWAAHAALAGQASAVVTAPIHKEALALAGIEHPGHTEYLQALAAAHRGLSVAQMPVRMMLSAPGLHTVLVSIHVALRDAIDLLTPERLSETIVLTHRFFSDRGAAPRIAVAGLNPHAGEGGLFGREEIETIAPVVQALKAQGLHVSGPHAPDTVFMRARQGEFDVVVAMYHDQGLIPVKLLGLEHGVNTTLGLPFVRTSPDHGTAFDLAGTGRASAESLLAAWAAAL
jgi:4-hydroxythreonine-4-phosphate dehydrogenase